MNLSRPITEISSAANPQLKLWLSLQERKGLRRHGQFLLSGRKLVPELLVQQPGLFQALIFSQPEQLEELASSDHVASLMLRSHKGPAEGLSAKALTLIANLPKSISLYRLAPSLFSELDFFATEAPLLIGNQPELNSSDLMSLPFGLELLTATGDPANLGALLRSSEAFGVRKVILLEECAHPFNPKVIRASSGSVFRLKLEWGPSIQDLASALPLSPRSEPWLYALSSHPGRSRSLVDLAWPPHLRLLVGEEGPGLPQNLIQNPLIQHLTIPMQPGVESLNATVAASLALWEIQRSRSGR